MSETNTKPKPRDRVYQISIGFTKPQIATLESLRDETGAVSLAEVVRGLVEAAGKKKKNGKS